MLRNRVVTGLLINDGVLYRTRNFVPDYRYTMNFVDAWAVDEIVALDITRPGEGDREHFYAAVAGLAKQCFVPLCAGGGVTSVEECARLLSLGADKISINSAAFRRPDLITEIAASYGSQCVVASIDTKEVAPGRYEVFSSNGTRAEGVTPTQWAARCEEAGAGEILITSIDRDGTLEGYDNRLNADVAAAVDVPVIVAGGAGSWQHFVDAFRQGGASAVLTTNIYHFTDTSIQSAKDFLHAQGVAVRT